MSTTVAAKEISAEAYFDAFIKYECSPHALKKFVDDKADVQIIDMRNPNAFKKSHVPGAVNVELPDIDGYADKLDKSKRVVVYCYDDYCFISARACLKLSQKGFNVQKLLGGYDVLVEKYPSFAEGMACTDKASCS